MKNIALELPPGLFTPEQTQLLNDRLREIQQNLGIAVEARGAVDLKGHKLLNVGDATQGQDGLNLRTAELRFPPTPSTPGGSGGGGNNAPAAAGPTDSTLMFSVSGALAIQAAAAPLGMLAKPRTAIEVVGLLQAATDTGPVVADLMVGEKKWATLTIPQGQTLLRMPAVGMGPIGANLPIRLDLVAVGIAPGRPGTSLTVLIRLA